MFECVINVSEGRDAKALAAFERAAGSSWRDRHSDPFHHRSVYTLINEPAALQRDVRSLATEVLSTLDLTTHEGAHPRLGVLDVVPFVALDPQRRAAARALRNDTAAWLGEHGVSVFLYGDEGVPLRSLPELRRDAFRALSPDFGPTTPDPRWGASAVGERPLLLAWNAWVEGVDLTGARDLARRLRGDGIRALGLQVGPRVQVSCNLIDPLRVGPGEALRRLEALCDDGQRVVGCELVGLAPLAVLDREPPATWALLDLDESRTIERTVAN